MAFNIIEQDIPTQNHWYFQSSESDYKIYGMLWSFHQVFFFFYSSACNTKYILVFHYSENILDSGYNSGRNPSANGIDLSIAFDNFSKKLLNWFFEFKRYIPWALTWQPTAYLLFLHWLKGKKEKEKTFLITFFDRTENPARLVLKKGWRLPSSCTQKN